MAIHGAAAAGGGQPDLVRVRRALISVSDKTGVAAFATALQREFGVELISTGGTAKALRDAGLTVKDVSEVTGFPEMMDGRVKTLHPLVHGALLGLRDNAEHAAAMERHGIAPIDLVCVNLYPFEATVAKPGCTFQQAIENIDIGGPSMIRSAAKNHRSVCVVTDPGQYEKVLKHLRASGGQTPYRFRLDLAMWAYARTAAYDAAIYPYLAGAYFGEATERRTSASSVRQAHGPSSSRTVEPSDAATNEQAAHVTAQAGLLPLLLPRLRKTQDLRYGENPHQLAGFYRAEGAGAGGRGAAVGGGIATARQLHGKALSYINILDADAAIELVRELRPPSPRRR